MWAYGVDNWQGVSASWKGDGTKVFVSDTSYSDF